MKKIKILMLHLNHGGVEKQTITMANALSNKYTIEIVSFYKLSNSPAYEIDDNIKIKYLYDGKPNREEFKEAIKKFYLIKAIQEGIKSIKILYLKSKLIKDEILLNDSDVYFSTRTEYGKLLSKYGKNDKIKITEEHNFIDDEKYFKRIKKNYVNLNYVVVISKWHEKKYKECFKNTNVNVVRIENILDKNTSKLSKLNNNAIIAVGRFDPVKDFLNTIEIMKYAVKKNPNLKLYLIGDGPERHNIETKIKEYGLEENVIMPGFVSAEEVEKYMLKSDIYIMTSVKECFPMVILEAYSCGLPVVSFDILSGPHEMVKNNKTGFLIKNRDCDEMAAKINKLLSNKDLIYKMRENAKEEAEKYTANSIIEKWYKIMGK